MRSTWTGLVPAEEGTYTMADADMAWAEGLPRADESYMLARVNGLIGQVSPWAAYIITGTLFGPVRLTIEVHDSQPDLEDEWPEVIETEFVATLSGTLLLVRWGGENIATLEGVLTPGRWGLRACARGRDEAGSREWSRDDEPVEEHLFQFWPGPQGAVILTTDAHGAGMRGER